MSIQAIAPSPLARLLLELEARAASGGVDAGGRRLILLKGGLLEVRPAPEDEGLGEFLIAAGRLKPEDLSRCKQLASEQRVPLEAVLHQQELVQLDVLLETRRALWLDRFVRGLGSEERAGKEPSLLTPEALAPQGATIPLLPFVLDALTRRACFGDAENIGRNATAWFEWLDTPQRARAAAWADLGEVDGPVQMSGLFCRHPAAPSRIAALARAGLARLSERKLTIPPAAPRTPSIAAPAPVPERRQAGSIKPPPLPPLAPGEAFTERPLGIEPLEPWFPALEGALDDPLDALERRVTRLEQVGASPEERAQAWLLVARTWREHFDSTDEAARACREAAAAAPELPEAVEAAAHACSVVGRPDLAYAYADAWAELLLHDPDARLRALLRTAHYATRAAKIPSALKALKEAAALANDDGKAAELYARALFAQGDREAAVAQARTAAKRYRDSAPELARSVLAWAHEVAPTQLEIVAEHAASLSADGYVEAAVAMLARAARNATSKEHARKLYRHAATRAEAAARPDLAADVMFEALDTLGPEEQALRIAVLDSFTAAGAVVEVAVLACELAQDFTGPARAALLTRAADARLSLPGDMTLSLELYTQALCAAPQHSRALSALSQLAESEPECQRALFDALERALRTGPERSAAEQLLQHLTEALAARGTLPMLEHWARGLALNLGIALPEPQGLDTRSVHWEADLRTLEQELRNAPPEARAERALALADHLRDDPARRSKARKLYEKVLEAEPKHALARNRLESLLRLEGDAEALRALAAHRVEHASGDIARIAALMAQAHIEDAQGHTRAAADACLAVLKLAPKHREAALLLSRLALKLGDPKLSREALTRRVDASLDPRERALALCALARARVKLGEYVEAVRHADAALSTDPRCATAAYMVLDLLDHLDVPRRLPALKAVRAVLGDSPDLMQRLAQAHYGTGDARGQLEALERHLKLSPFDALPALGLLALRTTGTDGRAILDALRSALSSERFGEGSLNAAVVAIERLWMLGLRSEAVAFVIEAVDLLGEAADELLDWAGPCVRDLGQPRLERAILERQVVRATGEARLGALRRLAAFHREQGARAAEARAYLRLLSIEPADEEALERLSFLYAQTGEIERLLSVLTVRVDLASDAAERAERLLSLACATLTLGEDPGGAEEFVRAALATAIDATGDLPDDLIRRGVGLLLGSKAPQLAFDALLATSEVAPKARACAMLEEAVYIAEHHLENQDLALRAATLGIEAHPEHTAFLVHFERLALAAGDVQTGREVYAHLSDAALGMHGRRALLYRAGRWLERAGATHEALDAVEQAFAIAPSQGAMLSMLERLARATGRLGALIQAFKLLAHNAALPRDKAGFLVRAAEACMEHGDPEQAFAHCEQALRELPDAAIEERAMAYLAALPEARRAEARQRLRALFQEQAQDAWATSARVRALLSLAGIEAQASALAQVETCLRQALEAIHADEDLPESERAELLRLHTEAMQRFGATPRAALVVPNGAVANHNEGREVHYGQGAVPRQAVAGARSVITETVPGDSLGPDTPYDARSLIPKAPSRVQHRVGDPAVSRARTVTDPWLSPVADPAAPERPSAARPLSRPELSAVPSPAPRVSEIPAGGPEAPTHAFAHASAEVLLDALMRGDRAALRELRDRQARRPLSNPALLSALREHIQKGPPRLAAIEGLGLLAEGQDAALAELCEQLLSYAEPNAARRSPPERPLLEGPALAAALLEAREDGELVPVFTLLAHVFQGAAPLFRRTLSSYGVSASDMLQLEGESPYAGPWQDVSSCFGVEHETYVRRTGQDRMILVPTHPVAILVGDQTRGSPALLRYRFARLFEGARPGSALLASLAPDFTQVLLLSLRAAFGPADSKSPPVAREAAALAAELWRTMPSAAQRQVGNLFRAQPNLPPYEVLLEQLCARAARVGLVLTQDIGVALEAFGMDGDPTPVARTAEDVERALAQRLAARELWRFALSDAYLSLRREALARP